MLSAEPFSILYWDETTAAQPFEAGIQRVVRRLEQALTRNGIEIVSVGFDTTRRMMRRRFPPSAQTGVTTSDLYDFTGYRDAWLLVPEIPMDAIFSEITPIDLGHAYGLRAAAIVHDLIPVKLAHDYDQKTVRRYEHYYRMFAYADLVFATTDYVANDLREFLQIRGLRIPDIVVHPLPAQFADTDRHSGKTLSPGPWNPLRLLTVSTWEPRKNLPRFLRAVARAQSRLGPRIELTIVGRQGGFPTYITEVGMLLSNIQNATAIESVSDNALAALYDSHHASAYSSFEEGFGMPILESLWLATPCLCHNASSMAEVAPGGGVMAVDMTDEEAICNALCRLAEDIALLPQLAAEIEKRPLRSWADYGAAVSTSLRPPVS